MLKPIFYDSAADTVLILHVAVVVFIVGGLLAIVLGNRRGSHLHWLNALWFRLMHSAAILFVVAETWLQVPCPLTTLELWLRIRSGSNVGLDGTLAAASCVQYWLGKVLYFTAPWWVFAIAYSLFATLVVISWVKYPPVVGKRHAPAAGHYTYIRQRIKEILGQH